MKRLVAVTLSLVLIGCGPTVKKTEERTTLSDLLRQTEYPSKYKYFPIFMSANELHHWCDATLEEQYAMMREWAIESLKGIDTPNRSQTYLAETLAKTEAEIKQDYCVPSIRATAHEP